jgi:hypothetical protein
MAMSKIYTHPLTSSNISVSTAANISTAASSALYVDGDLYVSGTITSAYGSFDQRITKIEERLGIMQVNEKLESQFNELKEMGIKYKELEARLMKKAAVISKLNS